jgi:Alginate lyase
MNRRRFLALPAFVLASRAASRTALVFVSAEEAAAMRKALDRDPARQQVFRGLARRALGAGPWSVTFHRPSGVEASTGPHDYYSEGPYWWPDPKNPKGPYIRRDGERNPARFMGNRSDIGEMSEAVLALGIAACFFDDADCARRAGEVLRVWYVDAKTRMNPNLEFGQAVRGHNTGRGTGIIDTVCLIHCSVGAALADASGKLDPAVASGVRAWFGDYLKWLNTSAKGLDEKKATNNHATWWTAQVAAYAAFTGEEAMRRVAWQHYRDWLVPGQVRPDGSCPREEARTKSLSYSAMNLDGYSVICRYGALDGQHLWRFKTPKGIGIEKAYNYLAPFVLEPSKWTKQQIEPFSSQGVVFPGLAGVGLESPQLLADYRRLPRARSAWVQLIDLLVRSRA